MSRIIIYAMGKLFQKHQAEINWEEIVAIADKKIEDVSELQSIPLIRPQQVEEYSYDYIAVFSDRFFEEIKRQLTGEYFIPESKILSWRIFMQNNSCTEQKIMEYYRQIIWEFQYHKILDIGMPLYSKYFFATEELFPNYLIQMDGVGKKTGLVGRNLYKNVFGHIEESGREYEVALLWESVDNLEEKISQIQDHARFILFHVPCFIDAKEEIREIDKILEKYPNTKRFTMLDVIFWIVDLSPRKILEDIGIYVVMHKPYQVQCDEMYRPLCVGDTYRNESYLSEKEGINISDLNEKINECTALYWIWKNTDTKYVGLNHYRRYFYNNGIRNSGNYLDKETASRFLKEYDMVISIAGPLYEKTVLEQIMEPLERKIGLEALEIMRKAIARHQPEYIEVFEHVMHSHNSHLCHMFITSREIFNQYCEWLFSFLIEAAESFDIEGYGTNEKRALGFWAERLLTTWLLKQDLKIKELPYVMT